MSDSNRILDKSIGKLLITENNLLNYDYWNLIKELRIKEELRKRSLESIKKIRRDNGKNFENIIKKNEELKIKEDEKRKILASKFQNHNSEKEMHSKIFNNDRLTALQNYSKIQVKKIHQKNEERRRQLHENITIKMHNFEEKNKEHLSEIRNKFQSKFTNNQMKIQISKSKHQNLLNKSHDEIIERQIKIYENWYFQKLKEENTKSHKVSFELNRIRNSESSAKNELVRNVKNEEIIKKIEKINESHNKQKVSSLKELKLSQNKVNLRQKKINLRKESNNSENASNSTRILMKHSENIRISNDINEFYDLNRKSIQKKRINEHIVSEKKINDYLRNVVKISRNNILLKPKEEQLKIFCDLKKKELEEKIKQKEIIENVEV